MSEIPATQHAIQIVAADEIALNEAKPVPEPGPTQILVKIEATGICFSDTKLLHAFTSHPRHAPLHVHPHAPFYFTESPLLYHHDTGIVVHYLLE